MYAPIANVVTAGLQTLCTLGYCVVMRPHHPKSLQKVSLKSVLQWNTNWREVVFVNSQSTLDGADTAIKSINGAAGGGSETGTDGGDGKPGDINKAIVDKGYVTLFCRIFEHVNVSWK